MKRSTYENLISQYLSENRDIIIGFHWDRLDLSSFEVRFVLHLICQSSVSRPKRCSVSVYVFRIKLFKFYIDLKRIKFSFLSLNIYLFANTEMFKRFAQLDF